MTHYGSLFFCLFLEKRGSVHYRREERTERTREATSALPHRPHRSDKLSGRVFSNTRLLSQFDNFYIHSHSPGYANFQFVVLLSSHRGGVAPDCMDFALKASFPWLQAPFRLRSGVFSHPEWVATQFNLFFYLREIEDFWGSEEDERSDRPTDTNRKTADFEADLHGRNF